MPVHQVGIVTMSGAGTDLTENIQLSAIGYGPSAAPPQNVLGSHVDQNLALPVEIDSSGFVYGVLTFSYTVGRVPMSLYLGTNSGFGNVTGSYPQGGDSEIYEIGGQWTDGDASGDAPGIVIQPRQTVSVPMWIQFVGAVSNAQASLSQKTLDDMTWQLTPNPSPPNTSYSGPQAANCSGTKTFLPFAHLPFSQGGTGNFVTPGNAVDCNKLDATTVADSASNPCSIAHSSVGKEIIASVECSAEETVLEAKCGFGIATLILPALKAAKIVATAKSADVLAKLPASARPIGKFLYDLYHADFLKSAPAGFRTPSEIVRNLLTLKTAYELLTIVPDLARSVSAHEYEMLATDLAAVAGLKPCISAIRLGAG